MAEPRITWLETKLKARREALSRILAIKPVTKAQEFRRQAFVQRALTAVESHSQRVGSYKTHLGELEQILTGAGEPTPVHETTQEEAQTAKNLGDL